MGMRAAAITALAAGVLGGCVERELTITSDPPGALVFVSDVEVGRTPVTWPFTWYGDYDVLLRLDGYETLKTHADITPPAYGVPPLDLFADLAPWTIHDRRYLHYTLRKPEPSSDEDLLRRAEAMQERNLQPVAP